MSFPRYPSYKDSGVEWLGSVPEHWRVDRLKRNLSLLTEKSDSKNNPVALENIEGWSGRFIASETEFEGDGVQFDTGDILFGKLRPYLAKVLLAPWPGEAVGDFHVLRAKPGVFPHFAQYLMLTRSFIDIVDGSTFGSKMPRAGWDFVGNMPLPIPSFDEQKIIAGFLDREAAKIDALVAEQEQLITLLKEKRQAVISHAVTKGLDPSVLMKDSGVEWLGAVPAHWQVRRVKDVTRLESGHTPSKTVPDYWVDCDIPWVSLNDSKYLAANDYITDTAVQINQLGIENSSARLLPAGSVVFTRDATIGLAAITTREMAVSQHLIAWCPTGLMDPLYLLRVFNAMKDHLDSYTFGATIKTIGMGDVKSLTTPVPPHHEQVAIAAFLGKELQVLDQLVDEAVLSIELLRERRSALISAAVTGQIDVRGLAPAQAQAA